MRQSARARRLMRAGHHAATHGDLEEAGALFARAVEACPPLPQPHVHHAHTRFLLGDRDGAVAAARDGMRRGPDLAAAQLLGAVTLYDARELEEADAAFARVLELDPGNDLARSYRALLRWRQGKGMNDVARLAREGLPESSSFLARLLILVEEEFRSREQTPPAPPDASDKAVPHSENADREAGPPPEPAPSAP